MEKEKCFMCGLKIVSTLLQTIIRFLSQNIFQLYPLFFHAGLPFFACRVGPIDPCLHYFVFCYGSTAMALCFLVWAPQNTNFATEQCKNFGCPKERSAQRDPGNLTPILPERMDGVRELRYPHPPMVQSFFFLFVCFFCLCFLFSAPWPNIPDKTTDTSTREKKLSPQTALTLVCGTGRETPKSPCDF